MKRITTFIRLLVCLIFMAATTQHALAAIDITATQPANGTGTTDDPYQIGTPGELYWFAAQVNNGQTTLCAKLTADIVVNENVLNAETLTLNGTPDNEWTPIGPYSNKFKGTFDGDGHTISGLYFNNTSSSNYPAGGKYIGLIGSAYGATIKNVVVKDSYLRGCDYLAGICGFANNSTKITNCGYEGYVYGDSYAYGIAYNYSATVKNCYSVSNKPLSNKATTNCYHDNSKYTSSTTYSTGKPSTAFARGEVAWLLGDAWGQKIGTDATPRLGGDKVYKNTYSGECPGEGYSNVDEHGVGERNHNCNEEGVCIQCDLHFISTADQLYAFAAKVNAGQTTLSAKLTADIVVNENVLKAGTLTLNGTPSRRWTPIGTSSNNFKGTFDGNGHTISGLYFKNTSSSNYPAGGKYIGLIGYAYGATIKNVVVKDSYLYGYQFVAGICGYAGGSTKITNCGYEGYVYGSGYYACGIAYNYSATVENCYSVSNETLADNATTNCYHDNTKYTESTTASTGKPSEAFASGEVAFLLGEGWGQKIGTDVLPIPGSDKVYKNTYSGECPGVVYSNDVDEHGVVTERNHNCNEEGACTQCGFYFISTADQLYAFAAKVNAGQTNLCAKLTADIVVNENVLKAGTFDLNGTPSRRWTPIGTYSNIFKGTFDGNGHTISGLYFNSTTGEYYPFGGKCIGLIGEANGATIKNVVVKDSYLRGYNYVAGICGYAIGSTKITNCGYEGYVYGSSYAYGIAYNSNATVENCYSVSNKTLAHNATTNCYHDNSKCTSSTTYSTGKPSSAFASGEVAFLLGDAWGQKIGTDVLPIPGGDKVYATALCPHAISYSNTPSDYIPITDGPEHYDSDGCCKACGAGQPATLVNGNYEIDNVGKLYWFANQVNNGQTTLSAKLTADIVVNENVLKAGTLTLNGTPSRSWTPIGTSGNNFQGTFDGNGHTISGLYFNNTTNSSYPNGGNNIGLIGYAYGAAIKNVVVKDSYLSGSTDVAGICGYADGSTQITNCGYEGYVYGSSYAYGIAYNANATVENCYSVSSQPLSNKATTNCYHDNTKYTRSTTASTGKPSKAFASGEVALLLGDAWGQKIGTDALPIPGSDKVYKNTYSGECPGEGYSNVDEHGVVTERNHNCNAEGLCIQCGVWHLISTADQLYAFAAKVNAGQTTLSAKLTADIVVNENVLQTGTFDLNGTPSRSWTPIGTFSNNFKGTFDGDGHTISGLYFYSTSTSEYPAGGKFIGLIGEANGATIKNVVVKDSYFYGYSYVSGICGYADGSTQITNCGYEGYVNCFSEFIYPFGIAYNYETTVENCYSVSNQPLARYATTNCYHDNIKYAGLTTCSTGKLSTVFASGEVAFLLGDAWGQKIGTDATPRLGGDKVYKNTYSGECPGEGYSNVDEHGVVKDRNHDYNADGLCKMCCSINPTYLVDGYYEIDNVEKLYWFAALVNEGQTTLCAKLTADIVVNENVLKAGTFQLNGTPSKEWTPIGTFGKPFKGTFDGNGHTISGLYFKNTTNSNYPAGGKYIGLIGYANGATIKNVVVKDSYLNGCNSVAGICGYAVSSTKITNCGYEGLAYASQRACSIADNYMSTVENCYSVSNTHLAYDATTNCYHDNIKCTGSSSNSTGKSSTAFANGEVAFLLGDAWGQKIGTDATPRLGGDKVYKNTYSGECSGEGYSNVDEHGVVTNRNHNFNEEGVCTHCGFYIISTADQLYEFAAKVNAGKTSLCAKLVADIVVNENVLNPGTLTLNGTPSRSWTPIGKSGNNFKGTFDGNGHTISGLYFDNTTNSSYPNGGNNIGLIGVADGATIKNVVVKDSYLYGSQYVAGICGYAYGSTQITNCGYEGYVNTSTSYSYGIVYNYSSSTTVKNCYSVSNQPLADKATTNCYHDNNKYTGSTANSTGKSSTAFASGEVAFLLGEGWGQKIGTDATPKLGGAVIYSITTTIATGGHGTFICPSYANEGETITCSSEPNIGYELVLKVNGNAHTGNTFTMPAENTTLLVDFTKIDYAVTTATGLTGGSISASATAQYQDQVTVASTPATGYKLDEITVTDASGNAVAVADGKFTMPASAVNVNAVFSKIDYAINKSASYVGGNVTVNATAQYQDQVSISVVPAIGYQVATFALTDASGNAIAVADGKFTMPASAVNVTASFSPTGYVENGKVYGDWVVTSDYTIAAGETLVIPAGTTVTTYGGAVIINNGTLKVEDEISGVTLAGDGVFNYTTLSKYDVTFGTAVYNGSPITIGNGLDVTYATKTFCGKTFTFDAESCTITYTNNVNASVGTRYAVVTWDFSGNTATKEFAILKRELNLTGFIANNKNYDGTTQATGSFSDDRIAGDELEFNYKCAFEDENVGTGKNVSFYRIEIDGGADADNYELVTTEGSASANINKAPLTIKANDFTINVGDDMPTFTVEYDGFVAAQNVEVLSTLPTVGVDITETSVDGTYDINVSGAEADNYEISYTKGTLTIKPENATSIDNVSSADVKIFARGNVIVVENAVSPIEVFDIAGSRIERQSEILSRVEIPMSARGVFVVRTGNTSQKVIVK